MSKKLEELALVQETVEVVPSTQYATNINIHDLRLSQDFESLTEVKQVVTTVGIGKPNPHTFFRVHPEWKGGYPLLEVKTSMKSEFYIVDPQAVPELQGEIVPRLLVPVITRDNRLYVWPLRVSVGDRKLDQAASSSLAAMQTAKTQWIRLHWQGHSFAPFVAKKELAEPEWPETTFERMVEIAFEGRVITNPDHPVVKALLGEE